MNFYRAVLLIGIVVAAESLACGEPAVTPDNSEPNLNSGAVPMPVLRPSRTVEEANRAEKEYQKKVEELRSKGVAPDPNATVLPPAGKGVDNATSKTVVIGQTTTGLELKRKSRTVPRR